MYSLVGSFFLCSHVRFSAVPSSLRILFRISFLPRNRSSFLSSPFIRSIIRATFHSFVCSSIRSGRLVLSFVLSFVSPFLRPFVSCSFVYSYLLSFVRVFCLFEPLFRLLALLALNLFIVKTKGKNATKHGLYFI